MIRSIFVVATIAISLGATAGLGAAVYLKYEGIEGEATGPDGAKDWFIADSFFCGVEKVIKESGEKGGTTDINIGVGELQECEITKTLDLSSAKLAQAAVDGKTLGRCDVCLTAGFDFGGTPLCYLHYQMERCFVKSWSTSGDADDRPTEEVTFYYNKIAFAYTALDEDGNERSESMNWDNEKHRSWLDGLIDIFRIVLGLPPARP